MIIIAGVLGLILSVKKAQRRKKMNPEEEKRKKPSFGNYRPHMYKPKVYKEKDLKLSMDRSVSKQNNQERPQRQFGSYPTLSKTPQKPLFRQTRLPEPEPEPEEEPYWEAGEWEDWAYQIYLNYPEVRQFLPDWFVKALEEELGNQE